MKRTNDQSLGELIREFIKTNNLEDRITEAKVLVIWEKVMGASIARYTQRITFNRNCLTINLSSAVLRNELSMGKTKIIKMLNKELEGDIIQELVLR